MSIIVKTINKFNLNFEIVQEKNIKNLANDQSFKIIDHETQDKTHEKINLKTTEKQVSAKIY